MEYYPTSILNLIQQISRLPGIGKNTAERLALHILHAPRHQAESLAQSLLAVKEKTRLCSMCFSLSDSDICRICNNTARDDTVLCVVEQPADMVAIEKSGAFTGLYLILQGALSPIDGVGPDDIKIRELLDRIGSGKVKEVVLATGTNLEGETTASFIRKRLESYPVNVTRIASGVPVGGDLKYVDQLTLKKAMETRRVF
ncbi:MAG: recombination mediator RecR [Desulfobacterales bacterium]